VISFKSPLRFATITAIICSALPLLPLGLVFIVSHAPDWLKNLAIYSAPLAALGSPAAYLLDRSGVVGAKFVWIFLLVNWAIYFVLAYLTGWFWFAWRYLRDTGRAQL
jgi:hypothetical protein